MQVRELTVDDYDQLIEVWKEAGLPYRPSGRDRRDRVAREMASPNSAFLAAEEKGVILGVVVATHDGRKGWINRLAVIPRARRRGIAGSLVAAAEEWLAEQGLLIIGCLIERENDASLSLFGQLGYARWDEIVYHAKRLDPDA
jgi:ribosomal protein S18 acetylase RimI-like enzyme